MCRRPACLFFLVLFIFLLCKILPDSSWREMLVIKGGRRRILWPRHRRTHRAMFKGSRPSYGISFESTPTVNVNWCNAFGTVAFNGFMSFFFPSSFLSFLTGAVCRMKRVGVCWHFSCASRDTNAIRCAVEKEGMGSFPFPSLLRLAARERETKVKRNKS